MEINNSKMDLQMLESKYLQQVNGGNPDGAPNGRARVLDQNQLPTILTPNPYIIGVGEMTPNGWNYNVAMVVPIAPDAYVGGNVSGNSVQALSGGGLTFYIPFK